MTTQVTIWHYIAAPFVFALLGVLWHLWRSIPLPLPDKLTNSWRTDSFLIPGGYRWTDFVYETEFDEDGYYRFDSWRNLKIAVGLVVMAGLFVILAMPDLAGLFAEALNALSRWMWERILWRLENPW